ncbi:MAG: protein phosphatase 2C domain-containing protein [Muribaculaceae bacterium]|nr:protein phosphatase 2C domain-containing protein [Muribaculaceae bacterium]
MKALHYSCQGESHKATNKVCQDFSYSEVNENLAIAIVCDGHGGARYFRSDIGAKYATDITKECVTTFIENIDKKLFEGTAFTQVYALNTEIQNDNFAKKTKVDVAMRQLFSSIIYRWQEKILEHAHNNPLTEAERASINPRYIDDFEAQRSLEKTYGCTLMCYVQTEDYWFAFHVGDGKCIAFDHNGQWSEPIPWDDRCFLNKTTSLCDVDALDEFRYCYQGDGEFPVLVFLGSDGIDDSFGEITNMVNFYAQVAKMFAKETFESSMDSIESTLPELSAKGSQDDMSIACIYDEERLGEVVKQIIYWQQDSIQKSIFSLNERIGQLLDRYNQFEGVVKRSKSDQIDLTYTITELKRAYQAKRDQAKKFDKFSMELGEDREPYDDEYGFGEQFVLIAEKRLAEQIEEDVEPIPEQTKSSTQGTSTKTEEETVLEGDSKVDEKKPQEVNDNVIVIEDEPVSEDKTVEVECIDSVKPVEIESQEETQPELPINNSEANNGQ